MPGRVHGIVKQAQYLHNVCLMSCNTEHHEVASPAAPAGEVESQNTVGNVISYPDSGQGGAEPQVAQGCG